MASKLFKRKINVVGLFLLLLMLAFYDVVFLNKTFKVTTANSQALPTGAYGQEHNKPRFIPVNGTDTPVMEEPVYNFIKQNIRRGILPLWNPHQACGYPLIGMLETAMFFPLSFIMYIFPEIFSWDLLILSRFLLAGLFVFWLMRTWRYSNIPSLVAGIAFMLSGPMVLFQYWTANVDILAPVLLIAIERLIRLHTTCSEKADQPCEAQTRKFLSEAGVIKAGGKNSLAFMSLAVFFTILAGHPEHIFLVNFYGLCFFAFRLWCFRKSVPVPKIIKAYLGSYVLAGGMACFIILPFFRNLLTEFWSAHPPNVGVLVEEQTGKALTLAMPHFFQRVNLTYQWVFSGWWGGYLGTIPLALAFLSLFQKQRRGLNFFFGVLAFLIIGKEYGLPIINWIGYLPLFNSCRYASHTVHLAALTVAILTGMGARAVLTRRNLFWQALIFSAALLLTALIHLLVLKIQSVSQTMPAVGVQAALFAFWILAILQLILFLKAHGFIRRQHAGLFLAVLVFSELFLYIHRERPTRFESFGKVPYIQALKSSPQRIRNYGIYWAFYPNSGTGFEVDDLGYFFGLVPYRFVEFVNTLFIPNYFQNNLRPPALRAIPLQGREFLLDLLNVRYIVGPATDEYAKFFRHFENPGKRYKTVYQGEVRVYERPHTFPRSFIVHRALFETDKSKTMTWLRKLGPQLRYLAVVQSPVLPLIAKALESAPIMDASTCQIVKYTPNEVLVETNMAAPGFLVLSDAYHPDWKVYVNGKKSRIFQTDYLIRSVFLSPGHHSVRFVFRPMSFYAGAVISLLAFTVLFLLLIPAKNRLSSPQLSSKS